MPPVKDSDKDIPWLRLTLWAVGVLLDPLVMYTFFLGDDRKCVQVDRKIGTAIFVARAVVDIINIVFSFRELKRDDYTNRDNQILERILAICWFIITICMFTLSLVMLILILRTKTRTVWYGMVPLIILISSRVIILVILSAKALPSKSFPVLALKFFYSYVCLGQVIGTSWYFLAIYTEARCWQKACRTHNSGCPDRQFRDRFLRCNETLEAYKVMNDFCSRNTTEYEFGVFSDAHQSGILEMRGLWVKILYCFRWAMHTISGFGSNLDTTSTDVLGNFLALYIIFAAVILFYFLVGQMQAYMQSDETEKKGN